MKSIANPIDNLFPLLNLDSTINSAPTTARVSVGMMSMCTNWGLLMRSAWTLRGALSCCSRFRKPDSSRRFTHGRRYRTTCPWAYLGHQQNRELSFNYIHAFENTVDGSGSIPTAFGGGETNLTMYQNSFGAAYGWKF